MPRTIKLGNDNTGITITWTPSASRLDISGYFDDFVGIEGGSFTLAEFFKELGITEKDVRKAFKEVASNGRL
jgi:DNA-binding transcriptional regulator PaaX